MKKQFEFIDSKGSTGGTITYNPGDRQLIKAIWYVLSGTFTAVPVAAIDWDVNFAGGWNIRHQGGNALGDIMSLNNLWALRQLTAAQDGFFNEVNTGVGASAFEAVFCFPFDLGEAKGNPHGNSLPLDGGEKLQFKIPPLDTATLVKLETANFNVSVFLEYGEGLLRYLPNLFENSAASSTAKAEWLPDNLFVLMVQSPAAGAATLQLQVYDGDGISVIEGGFADLVRVANTKYDFETGLNSNYHWEFFGASQNLLKVRGTGFKLSLKSGSGAVNFAHLAIVTNRKKLIRSAEIVESELTSESIEAGQSGASSAEIEGLSPSSPGISASAPNRTLTPGFSVFQNR